MALTIQVVLFIVAALLALIASFPIPTGTVNLLALSIAFIALGLAIG